MGIALREAKESRAALAKIRMGQLDSHAVTEQRELESEASQLSAIFASIILNMRMRLDEARRKQQTKQSRDSNLELNLELTTQLET